MTSQKFYFDRSAIVDPSAKVFGFIFTKADDSIDFKDIYLLLYRQQIVEEIS